MFFFLVIRNSSNKRRIGTAALIRFFVPNAALIQGGVYSGAALIRVNTVGSLLWVRRAIEIADIMIGDRPHWDRGAY